MTILASVTTVATVAGSAAAQDAMTVADRFRQNNPEPVVHTAGWMLRPLVELRAGYTDNVDWVATEAKGSPELTLRGSIEATRETGLLQATLRASLETTQYASRRFDAARNTGAGATLALRPSQSLTLRTSIAYEENKTPTSANGIEIDGDWVPYASFAAFRRVPLTLGVEASIGRHRLDVEATSTYNNYDELVTQTGIAVSQDFRSGWQHGLRTRATWSAHDALEAFIEGEAKIERYVNDTADTDQYSLAVGAVFEPHPLVRAEILAGYAYQDYRIAGGTSGIIFDGDIVWYMSPLVTVTLDASREFRGNVFTTADGAFSTEPATTDRIGLSADWEPLRRLLVSAGSAWTVDETASGDRRDTFVSLSMKAQYVVFDRLHAWLEVEHQSGQSNLIGDVSRNRISLGVSTPY